jgi:hypothetical protein
MKASIVTTLAILIVVVIIGRRQVDQLAQLKAIAKTDSEDQSVVASSRLRVKSSVIQDRSIEGITKKIVGIYANNEPDSKGDRTKAEAEFMGTLINLSVRELEGVFREMKEESTLQLYSRARIACYCLRLICDEDPLRALDLGLESLEWDGFQETSRIWRATHLALEHLARNDPEAAWAWFSEYGGTPPVTVFPARDRGRVANQLLAEMAKKDFGLAFKHLKDAPVLTQDISMFGIASSLSLERAPDYVKAVRESGLSEKYKAGAWESLALKDLSSDFRDTLKILRDEKASQSELKSFADGIRRRGGGSPQDPNWLDWVISQSNGKDSLSSYQKRIIRSLQQSFTSFDYAAAGNWINSKPKGAIRDYLALRYAYDISYEEPAAALEWTKDLPRTAEVVDLVKQLNARLNPRPGIGIHR